MCLHMFNANAKLIDSLTDTISEDFNDVVNKHFIRLH
jgi:hypothetical protein